MKIKIIESSNISYSLFLSVGWKLIIMIFEQTKKETKKGIWKLRRLSTNVLREFWRLSPWRVLQTFAIDGAADGAVYVSCAFMFLSVWMCMCAWACVFVCMCDCVSVSACVWLCVCVFIWGRKGLFVRMFFAPLCNPMRMCDSFFVCFWVHSDVHLLKFLNNKDPHTGDYSCISCLIISLRT